MGNTKALPLNAGPGNKLEGGSQLHVLIELYDVPIQLPGALAPHLYGDSNMVGAYEPTRAVPLARETANSWVLGFVIPSDHEPLEFKFLLKPRETPLPWVEAAGEALVLVDGATDGHQDVIFNLDGGGTIQAKVRVCSEAVSPFVLASSFRAHRDAMHEHGTIVESIPDVVLDEMSAGDEVDTFVQGAGQLEKQESLPGDLRTYEVKVENSLPRYPADSAEDPILPLSRTVTLPPRGRSPVNPGQAPSLPRRLLSTLLGPGDIPCDGVCDPSNRCVSVKDLVVLGTSESETGTSSTSTEGQLPNLAPISVAVDRNISFGLDPLSPRFPNGTLHIHPPESDAKLAERLSGSGGSGSFRGLMVGSDGPNPPAGMSPTLTSVDSMGSPPDSAPGSAKSLAAGGIADAGLGPKERRRLAIILVGLPARGKTYTAAKLTRYLRWLGHDTKHFNVGKYRRLKLGAEHDADFFSASNIAAVEQRNEVAVLAMEDMLTWMEEGGQIGVFDATNSTRERRNMLLSLAEGHCKVIFLETICNDRSVILRNAREKIRNSPDYLNMKDEEAGLHDFLGRIANYEAVYEPVNEGSYIKMIDMASGSGGQMQVRNMSGYLPGRIVFFLVNTHIQPRPIFLTRHGESLYNVRGRIGGDAGLSSLGEQYALKLAEFVNKRLKTERAASVWTSTLQRTMLTGRHIAGFPKVQWRALDEINAGVCDGMTYQEIKEEMPEEYQARKQDKLRYRYPRGESYLDVVQRLEPVIVELERQKAPVVVIAHQAVLRCLYAYFMDKLPKDIPHMDMPLHTIIELYPGANGVCEKRYRLME